MKKIILLFLLLFAIKNYSQSVTVNTTKYTVDQLVNQVLINSPCVSGTNVNSKTGTTYGSTNGIGYFENSNANFPFSNGVVLTTGDVTKIPSPNSTILSDGTAAWKGDADLEANLLSQSGISINSINASYIEFDFQPKTPNFDFSFLFASEEYGTSQCAFSDAFAFLLKDVTNAGANTNLAVIPNTNIPVSVETIRNANYNSNCASANPTYFGAFNGSGFGPAINFNGQTVAMLASATGLNINHIYRIKIVITDGGNNTGYDSAIFLKGDSFNIGQDVLGLDYTVANKNAICSGSSLPVLSATGLKSGTTFVWKKEGIALSPAETGANLDLNTLLPLIDSGTHKYSVTYLEPGCTAVTDEITVAFYPPIGVIKVPDIYTCDSGASTYDFDLTKNTTIIMAGVNQATNATGILDDLPAGTLISYYLANNEAVTGTNPVASPLTILSSLNGKPVFVRVQNPITSCFEIQSFQLQIVAAPVVANTPVDITLCARNPTEIPQKALFDFTDQKALLLGSQDPVYNIVTFHSTISGAQNNTNVFVLTAADELLTNSRTIYVRIENKSNTSCYVTSSFKVNVTPFPEVDALADVYVCTSYKLPVLTKTGAQYWTGTGKTGVQLFAGDLVTTTSDVYVFNQNGNCTNEDYFKVTIINLDEITPASKTYCTEYALPALPYAKYYTLSGGDATAGNTEIPSGTLINTAGDTTIYVWISDLISVPSCQEEKPFTITIIPFEPLPYISNRFDCTSYRLFANPNGGTYYTGRNKGLPIIPIGTVFTTTTDVYLYKESGTSPLNCSSEKKFTIFIGAASITPPADLTSCSSYELPYLQVGQYRTESGGAGIGVPGKTLINSTTTLWYYVKGQTCVIDKPFTITVEIPPLPLFTDTPPICDVYYLPAVAHTGNYYTEPGGTGFIRPAGYPITSTQTIYFYDKAAVGTCSVEGSFLITIYKSPKVDARPVEVIKCGQPYVLDDLTNGEYYEFAGEPSPTNPILPPGYVITAPKTIYVYAAATAPNTCVSEYAISLLVTYVNRIDDVYACDTYTLPAIVGQGDYYTKPNGSHGTGVKLTPPYAPITTNTTLYVYAEDNSRVSCSDEDAFTVTIYNTPVVAPIAPITRCTSYILPAFIAPANRYFTQSGGVGVTGNTEKFPGDVITASTTIYAYADSGTSTTKLCFDEEPMQIIITEAPKPVPNPTPICHDFETGIRTNSYVSSGYTAPQYAFEWKKEDGTLVGTAEDFSTNVPGNYTLTVTNLAVFGCTAAPVAFTIIESAPPSAVTVTTSGWFTESQTVTINAVPSIGDGSNFLYSLDRSTPQTSAIFTNVTPGSHDISISDTNGCGATIPITIRLINSPKYFTPNNDGFNDTWKITGFPSQANPKLFIFDRYGKFLKELNPFENGWDGTFNGYPLPADDYWFTVSYTEDTVDKVYKSHFSLKR
ncbi:T9SS type B sorting domain-containing protein [Flavobacterium restrictum]|uniref:T9SS type B sorting domain-containing protein n=1 Tax=Flavobacterium restrictum TaxID=2594428 RepID=A0A553E2E5_9FLAO|nr:T9SS type B sorting domain-containing protein [Flavobacterium restrictum]TRX39216.1 T9SS type B sorting domain-containing protein [Flavobacterium restrictum]